jgi:hypothetical protein
VKEVPFYLGVSWGRIFCERRASDRATLSFHLISFVMASILLHTARVALESAAQLGGRHAFGCTWAMAQRSDAWARGMRPMCVTAVAEKQVCIAHGLRMAVCASDLASSLTWHRHSCGNGDGNEGGRGPGTLGK